MVVLENVYKTYHEGTPQAFDALKAVNMHIRRGEMVILSGVSGSGKSTLLSLIAALDKPTSGKVVVNGEAISKLPDLHASAFRAKTVGVVFQHFNLLEALSVEENVIVPLVHTDLSLERVKKMAYASMQKAAIEHKAAQPVKALSGGEKQRCAIARALVRDPALILCDEPTANLDKANALKFIDILKSLKASGKTIVVATHDPLFESLDFVDRIIPMREGTIVDA
jgi:putative ABC transport system ATP-binding protein